MNTLPLIAIVGRPNVGKSSLFNRLLRRKKAITHDRPGVTRDRLFGRVGWLDRPFDLVDTGGIIFESGVDIEAQTFDQVQEAVAEAQLILMVVDGREGLTPLDREVAELLRRSNKSVHLAVNKVDGQEQEAMATADFHGLGFPMTAVSAEHGHGIEVLCDILLEKLPRDSEPIEKEDEADRPSLRIALLGRPNVGKSSLINTMLGQDRLIVSPTAGTTRDSVDVVVERGPKFYTFVDTAGMRRKSVITDTLERFSVLKAIRSSRKSQVVILLLDAVEGLVTQDKKLLAFLAQENLPFIVAANKIDLVPSREREAFKKNLKDELQGIGITHVPVVYTSTVTRAGLNGLLPLAEKLWAECQVRIGTGQLNRAVQKITERYQPPMVKGRRLKMYYLTQAEDIPPTFVCFVNDPDLVKPSYERYLENQMRKSFKISMAPVRILFRPSHGKK